MILAALMPIGPSTHISPVSQRRSALFASTGTSTSGRDPIVPFPWRDAMKSSPTAAVQFTGSEKTTRTTFGPMT